MVAVECDPFFANDQFSGSRWILIVDEVASSRVGAGIVSEPITDTCQYLISCRFSPAKQIYNSTLRFTCENQSRISVHLVIRPSRTPPTSPNTRGFTWASSRTDVRFVNASSPSYLTSSSTSEPTRATNPISAEFLVSLRTLLKNVSVKSVCKKYLLVKWR